MADVALSALSAGLLLFSEVDADEEDAWRGGDTAEDTEGEPEVISEEGIAGFVNLTRFALSCWSALAASSLRFEELAVGK